MKKIIFSLFLIMLFSFSFSQNKGGGTEKSIYGIQTGLLGFWIHNESRITNEIVLKSEIGLDFGYLGGEFNRGESLLFYPSIRLEPRFYYNLRKRNKQLKNISKNSANFLTLSTTYYPNWFLINSNLKNDIYIYNQISIIPKWGIKRNINHFTFETGIGYGVNFILDKDTLKKNSFGVLDMHLRIGYTF